MYIYDVLVSTLSAPIIHINLNVIFYTNVERSPTETLICIIHACPLPLPPRLTHTRCRRNWILILFKHVYVDQSCFRVNC